MSTVVALVLVVIVVLRIYVGILSIIYLFMVICFPHSCQGVLIGSVWVASFYTLWFCPSISLLFQILINTISVYLVYSLVIMIILWVIVVGTINYIIQSHIKSPKDLLKIFRCCPLLRLCKVFSNFFCTLPFSIRYLLWWFLTIQYQKSPCYTTYHSISVV